MDAMIAHPATLVPKYIYEKYGNFDIKFKVAGDLDWFQRTYALGIQFEALDFVVSNMSMEGASNNMSYELARKERWMILCKKYKNVFYRLYRYIVWNLRYIKKNI